jgi:hypothetical protein
MDNLNSNYRVVPKNNILNPSECNNSCFRSVQKNYLQSLGVLLENFTPSFNPSILGVQHLLEYFMLPFSPKEISAITWSAAPA